MPRKANSDGPFEVVSLGGREGVGTGVMRWEEPHHPGPGLQLDRHNNPQSPTLQHDLPLQARLHPRGRSRLASVATPDEAHPAAATAPDDANDLRGFHFRRLMRKPL